MEYKSKIFSYSGARDLGSINNYVFTACHDEVDTKIHHETRKVRQEYKPIAHEESISESLDAGEEVIISMWKMPFW